MTSQKQSAGVKTSFLVLSDTHGSDMQDSCPFSHADVAIHCGDLTEESKLEEFKVSLALLKRIHAPLKLVIAGNHDFTMDVPMFRKKVADLNPPLDPCLVEKEYGNLGEARQLFDDARSAGITFLDEGTHQFVLENGALLTVYASPWMPSLGEWGFQYRPALGHRFDIGENVNVAVTHGLPKGVLDYTEDRQRAGCPDIFGAIARARPQLHCFGHIHEGWGAKLVTWRDQISERPSYFTDIHDELSTVIENLGGFRYNQFDDQKSREQKSQKLTNYRRRRIYPTNHCANDANPLRLGDQILFVNAAIEGPDEQSPQLPWLVKIELPRAGQI